MLLEKYIESIYKEGIALNQSSKKALKISSVCVISYFFSYVLRNVLSVATPEMIKEDFFTKEYIGLLSSTYFVLYAVGQLVNGFIGDRVRPKYMMLIGLEVSSCSLCLVPVLQNRAFRFICFAVMGFGLSMVRGPLTKLIAENTDSHYAQIVCTLLSSVSYFSPLVASLLAMFLPWRAVFFAAGGLTAAVSAAAVLYIHLLEKRGAVIFVSVAQKGLAGFLGVFKLNNFFIYLFISAMGEIVGTSINFWIPTYLSEHLALSENLAYSVYSAIAISGLFAPFITLVIYRKFIKNGVKLGGIMYLISTICFALLLVFKNPFVNAALLLLAKMAAGCAVGAVWSVYIPGLAKSGLVSSANGVIDSAGYAAAALANVVFSVFMQRVGWGGLIVMWSAIMLLTAAVVAQNLFVTRKKAGAA